jgi:hypothetical protein
MNNIIIFKDVTTDDVLAELEAESLKYDGLYVDMDDSKQRKYVKDKAGAITGILKVLDRARIDKAKVYKIQVEDEAALIRGRLEAANKPFTLLIDDYSDKRAKILAAEKLSSEIKEAQANKLIDHDDALIADKLWEYERADRERAAADAIVERKRLDDEIAQKATDDAVEREKSKAAHAEAVKAKEEADRIADKNHCAKINCDILTKLLTTGITEKQAKQIIGMAINKLCGNMRINY